MPLVAEVLGLKKYAAGQIVQWLYQKRVSSFDEMTNLKLDVRKALAEKYDIPALEVTKTLEASDGTKKYLCRARDGERIECVLIPVEEKRFTVCVSTQAGCAMGCAFCRTGKMGLGRNLTMGEILCQLLIVMRDSVNAVTNILFMGMGEPMANVTNVANALEVILSEDGFLISKNRVTVSTAGAMPGLFDFASGFGVKVAI